MPLPVIPPQYLPISAQWCLEAPAAATPARKVQPCIGLEVASTPQQQIWGLMARPPLPPLRGMWFPYQQAQTLRFWMHRTPAPLDMLFLRQGRVIAIEAGALPCPHLPCRSYGPDEAADGVIELGSGQASALGIKVGSPVVIVPIAPARPIVPAKGGH